MYNFNFYKIKKFQKGLSLIESMVAITILVVGILGIVQAFPYGLKIDKDASSLTIANNLAQEKIEEQISLGYDNISVGEIEAKHRLSDESDEPYYNFWRETNVQYVDGDLNPSSTDTGLKEITTTVYWVRNLDNKEENTKVISLISKF